MTNKMTLASVACAAGLVAAGARAQSMSTAPSDPPLAETVASEVSYRDLDISRPSGAERLLRRIEQTADYLCGYRPQVQQTDPVMDAYLTCRKAAIEEAVTSVHSDMRTARAARLVAPTRLATR